MTRAELLVAMKAIHAAHYPEAPYDVDSLIAKRRREMACRNLVAANASLERAQQRLGSDLARALATVLERP